MADDKSVPSPGVVLPGSRTAVEMALVAIIVGLVGLRTDEPFVPGVVAIAAPVGVVVVLFWGLNGQAVRLTPR